MREFLIVLEYLVQEEEKRLTRKRSLKLLRDQMNPFYLEEEVFRSYFRFPKTLCYDIISEMEQFDRQKSNINFTCRALAALHFLGHGSYQKAVASNYLTAMGQATVSRSITSFCSLLVQQMGNKIQFPQRDSQKAKVKERFYEKFQMKSTIGAIDCTHIAIIAPPIFDEFNPAHLYMNRKGYYSLNVEAICDSELRFLSIYAKFPGSCHDSGIWQTTAARIYLIRTYNSSRPCWLIADAGYPLEPWILTSFSDPCNEREEIFNKTLNRARNTIERAFGRLKSIFRCLHKHRTLHYKPNKAALIVYSCAILHNILIDSGINTGDLIEEDDINLEDGSHVEMGEYYQEGLRVRNAYVRTIEI